MADGASDVAVPRFSSELRSMRCEQCLLNKNDGSASFSQGNGCIFCAVKFQENSTSCFMSRLLNFNVIKK